MRPLKIYVCLIVEDDENNIWHQHFTRTLRKMGHEIFLPPMVGLVDAWYITRGGACRHPHQARVTEGILSDVRNKQSKHGIDLFFCNMFPFQFTPELFKGLTGLGIPSVYFFCDNFAHKTVAERYAPCATLNWVPEKNAVPQFEASGSRFIHLPMAANPDINYPVDIKETVDVSFLGSKNSYRRNLLGKVLSSGLNLKVYGGGWHPEEVNEELSMYLKSSPSDRILSYIRFKKNAFSRFMRYSLAPMLSGRWYNRLGREYESMLRAVAYNKYLNRSESNEVYSFSSVSIGINDQFNSLLKERIVIYTKLRDFEAAMAGACYITQATPEGPELFEDEKEVIFYSTAEELIDKAGFLLKNEPFRKKLRAGARKRALSEHTWEHRFNRIFSEIGLA